MVIIWLDLSIYFENSQQTKRYCCHDHFLKFNVYIQNHLIIGVGIVIYLDNNFIYAV